MQLATQAGGNVSYRTLAAHQTRCWVESPQTDRVWGQGQKRTWLTGGWGAQEERQAILQGRQQLPLEPGLLLFWKGDLKTPTVCRDSAKSWNERSEITGFWSLCRRYNSASEGQVRSGQGVLESP